MMLKSISQYFELLKLSGLDDLFLKSDFNGVNLSQNMDLASLEEKYKNCTKCPLSQGRIKFVYGEGSSTAKLMLIGEGPGAEENKTGKPFVGSAGQLLTKMLNAININRKDVYIANIVKCRPPGNRNPLPSEISACIKYLEEQIEIIQPKILLLMGKVAAQTLLKNGYNMTELRSKEFKYRGIQTFVSYHPAALLYHPQWKKPAWIDLQKIQKIYQKIGK